MNNYKSLNRTDLNRKESISLGNKKITNEIFYRGYSGDYGPLESRNNRCVWATSDRRHAHQWGSVFDNTKVAKLKLLCSDKITPKFQDSRYDDYDAIELFDLAVKKGYKGYWFDDNGAQGICADIDCFEVVSESINEDSEVISSSSLTEKDVLDAVEKLSDEDDMGYVDYEAIENNSPTIIITPNGTIIDATEYDTHGEFLDRVFEYINVYVNPYDFVVDKLGFMTLNTGDGFNENRCKVVLYQRLTQQQSNLLQEWLDKRLAENKPILVFTRPDVKTFEAREDYDSRKIITSIQKSFMTGFLEEVELKNIVDSEGNQLSAEQVSFFSDSKARDDNGNLLVLYHGTRKGGFSEFDSTKGHAYVGTNFGKANVNFFTTSFNNAKGYSWSKDKNKSADTMNYVVYVNIVNPLVIDAKGEYYTGIKRDNIKEKQLKDLDNFSKKWVNSRFYDLELSSDVMRVKDFKKDLARIGYELEYDDKDESYTLRGISGGFGSALTHSSYLLTIGDVIEYGFDDGEGLKPHDDNITGSESTNDIIRDTIENHPEYDGIIFKNIVDSVDGWGELGTTVVTLKSAGQIKSIDNKTPTSSNNINEAYKSFDHSDIFYADNAVHLKTFLENHKNSSVRVEYDDNLKCYVYADGYAHIHSDLADVMANDAYYRYQDNLELDDNDEEIWNEDAEVSLVFIPNGCHDRVEDVGSELGCFLRPQGYVAKYKYSFGTIVVDNKEIYEKCSLFKILGGEKL